MFLLNAFSLGMLTGSTLLRVSEVTLNDARQLLKERWWQSGVGHQNTADVFAGLLGVDVPMRRMTFQFTEGSEALVGQYKSPRLPEGATELPEGARVVWYFVTVEDEVEA